MSKLALKVKVSLYKKKTCKQNKKKIKKDFVEIDQSSYPMKKIILKYEMQA